MMNLTTSEKVAGIWQHCGTSLARFWHYNGTKFDENGGMMKLAMKNEMTGA